MSKKKDAREHLHKAKQKESDQCTEEINDSSVGKKSQEKVLKEYQRMINL